MAAPERVDHIVIKPWVRYALAGRWRVARGSPHAAAVPLSDAEAEARRRELQQLTRSSLT